MTETMPEAEASLKELEALIWEAKDWIVSGARITGPSAEGAPRTLEVILSDLDASFRALKASQGLEGLRKYVESLKENPEGFTLQRNLAINARLDKVIQRIDEINVQPAGAKS